MKVMWWKMGVTTVSIFLLLKMVSSILLRIPMSFACFLVLVITRMSKSDLYSMVMCPGHVSFGSDVLDGFAAGIAAE